MIRYIIPIILVLAFDASPRLRKSFADTPEQLQAGTAGAADSVPLSRADSLPYITDLEAVESPSGGGRSRGRRGRGGADNLRKHWGNFKIVNKYNVPFILRLTFENRGALTHVGVGGKRRERVDKSAAPPPVITLRDIRLRYRRPTAVRAEKPLAATEHRGGGYVYEVRFLPEDVQELYEMELWGSLDDRESQWPTGGTYEENVTFEIVDLTR